MIYRQGDILIQSIEKLPQHLKKLKTNILAEGEATGHKHQLIERKPHQFEILKDKKGNIYLRIFQPTELVHEEHKPIIIEKGCYIVKKEKEYDYFTKTIRKVCD